MSFAAFQGTHCIVLGVESQIGLCLIRELAEAGVRVVAMTDRADAIGLASNKVWRRELIGPARSPAWLQRLRELGDELPQCSLITVSEVNTQWLVTHRAELGQLRPALPSPSALVTVLDKQLTLQAAAALGMAVPLTQEPASAAEALGLADGFPYPVVLKWKDPNGVAPRLNAIGVPLLKAEYVYDAAGLRAVAAHYASVGAFPLVQQYCTGRGLGQFLFMHEGRAVRRFQHLRVAEWPPEGGFSSVCDTVAPDALAPLMAQSEALLKSIGWEGVAMVEYRLDQARNKAWLMEINGRFWGSFPLAYHAGAGFALCTHAAALGLPMPDLPAPSHPLRCRMMSTELKRLVRLLLQPGRIADRQFQRKPVAEVLRFITDFLRPGRRYYVWQWRDPRPWWADLRNLLKGALGR